MYKAKDFLLSPKEVPMKITRKEYSYYKQSIRPIERMISEHTLRKLSQYVDIEVYHSMDKRVTIILIEENNSLSHSKEVFDLLRDYGELNSPYRWNNSTPTRVLTISYSKFDFTGIEALSFIIDSIIQSIVKIESDDESQIREF